MRLTDKQVAAIKRCLGNGETWDRSCPFYHDDCVCDTTIMQTLLADRAELVTEVEKLWEAYWRARACGSVETCNAECWDCMFPPHDDDQEATR